MAAKLKDFREPRKAKRRGDNFPLFLRPDGRWSKKIKGRHRYFGRDKAEALKRYEREMGLCALGMDPDQCEIGLRELFNRYLTSQQRGMTAGKIGVRSDSVRTLRRVL